MATAAVTAERTSRGAISTTGSMSSAQGTADVTGDTMERSAMRAAVPRAIDPRPTSPLRRPLPLPLAPRPGGADDDPPETETHVARVPRGLVKAFRELVTFDAPGTTSEPTRSEPSEPTRGDPAEPTRFEPPSFAWEGMDDDPAPAMSIDLALPDPWSSEPTTVGIGHLEAIDEPPETTAPIVLAEHRRAVVVAAVIDGPAAEAAPLAATLGELAYKRGGLVVADDPVVAFGLEIAGEDDAATAMAFALDAQLAAREARAVVRVTSEHGGKSLRPRGSW